MIKLVGAMLMSLAVPALIVTLAISDVTHNGGAKATPPAAATISLPATPAPAAALRPAAQVPSGIPVDDLQEAAIQSLASLVKRTAAIEATLGKGQAVPTGRVKALRSDLEGWTGTNYLLIAGRLEPMTRLARSSDAFLSRVLAFETGKPGTSTKSLLGADQAFRNAFRIAAALRLRKPPKS